MRVFVEAFAAEEMQRSFKQAIETTGMPLHMGLCRLLVDRYTGLYGDIAEAERRVHVVRMATHGILFGLMLAEDQPALARDYLQVDPQT